MPHMQIGVGDIGPSAMPTGNVELVADCSDQSLARTGRTSPVISDLGSVNHQHPERRFLAAPQLMITRPGKPGRTVGRQFDQTGIERIAVIGAPILGAPLAEAVTPPGGTNRQPGHSTPRWSGIVLAPFPGEIRHQRVAGTQFADWPENVTVRIDCFIGD